MQISNETISIIIDKDIELIELIRELNLTNTEFSSIKKAIRKYPLLNQLRQKLQQAKED